MIQIRSYRHVFDLERRIYRVDRIRLNPGGIPVRGVVYFLALLAGALVMTRLPLIGLAIRQVPWYARDVILPGALAAPLTVVRVEGRPFHLAVRALLRLCLSSRRIAGSEIGSSRASAAPAPGARWHPAPILMLPDGSDARTRRLRYTGPGALHVAVAHERRSARGPLVWLGLRAHIRLRERPSLPSPARGEILALERATRLRVG